MNPLQYLHRSNTTGKWTLFFSGLIIASLVQAQVTTFNFRHLTSNDGLSDGVVHAIKQDKFGFIWIGTSYGLNRFDGINIKAYFSKAGDSCSVTDNFIYSLYLDNQQNLWVGTMRGLCRLDYSTNRFIRYHSPVPSPILDIKQDNENRIWLGTADGLWIADDKNLAIRKFNPPGKAVQQKIFQFSIRQIFAAAGGKTWYLATDQGIRIFDPLTASIAAIRHDPADQLSLSSDLVHAISIDSAGYLWAACSYDGSILNRIDLASGALKQYKHFIDPQKKWSTNTISNILTDRNGNVWFTSATSGLSLYNPKTDDFDDYMTDPFIPNSLLSNTNVTIYQDSEGIIWLGTPGYGLSYFNPGKEFFHSIQPPFEARNQAVGTWCRSACEDKEGNLWLATGRGLMKYDRANNQFSTFANEAEKNRSIYFNSVRALLEDDNGDIWIGTAKGLNRYHPSSAVMDFFTEKQGIPAAFFWMIVKDRNGTIWLGSTFGLYRYDRQQNHFDDLSKDSLLSKYAHRNIQALYADKHNRLWIGVLDIGLVLYDIDKQRQKLLTVKDSLISDTRFSSFAEDHSGIIWIGAEQGLTAYDPATGHSRFFTRENGLTSDRTNNIMVDSLNRIWIGTSNGLCLMNAKRDKVKVFTVNDGLLTNQFNEQSAYRTRDGLFIFPTYKGFLVFRPETYRESSSPVPVYLTSFKILDKEINPIPENLERIDLRHNQNFFSLSLAGLNYMNPLACTYAYQLDPFDKEWIHTTKREINYTNVPAGHYTFRYKVIVDNESEDRVPEKTIRVSIGQVFYKTTSFRLLALLLLTGGIIAFYRYRLLHREKILVLQNKAQLLEKEKTQVMYESLKQHLNPHFLFNSLTSLRSLIKTDPRTATGFLDGMSKVYRYVLKSGEQELMPLQDELDFVKTFIELQKTRFRDGLEVKIAVDAASYSKYIVPVTLQTLVENAIKHNTADKESPLLVEIFTEDGFVVVRNNLQRYRIVESSNKQGLVNLRSLYHFFSDKPVQVMEDERFFTVKIPLL